MGITDKNLCDSCTNFGCEFQSGIVRTKCAFYMPPTVEAIPKADYNARLKADMVAMLTEIQLEIEELDTPNNNGAYMDCSEIIQQKIDALKENTDAQAQYIG